MPPRLPHSVWGLPCAVRYPARNSATSEAHGGRGSLAPGTHHLTPCTSIPQTTRGPLECQPCSTHQPGGRQNLFYQLLSGAALGFPHTLALWTRVLWSPPAQLSYSDAGRAGPRPRDVVSSLVHESNLLGMKGSAWSLCPCPNALNPEMVPGCCRCTQHPLLPCQGG